MGDSIRRAQVMPLLLQACPSFSDRWRDIDADDLHLGEHGKRLGFIDAGEGAKHLIEFQRQGRTGEMDAVFAVIE